MTGFALRVCGLTEKAPEVSKRFVAPLTRRRKCGKESPALRR